jgi:hypothetical protein
LDKDKKNLETALSKIKHSEIDQEIQTEIGMDYFDHERSSKRGLVSTASKGSRVGGGGTISKPPKI